MEIEKLTSQKLIRKFVQYLSKTTGLESDFVQLSIKNFIGRAIEETHFDINPLLSTTRTHILAFVKFFFHFRRAFYPIISKKWSKPAPKIDILIDDHTGSSVETLYGKSFIKNLEKEFKLLVTSSSTYERLPIYFSDFVKCVLPFLIGHYYCRKIKKKYNLDFRRFLSKFFIEFLQGKFFRKHFHPRLIISGNDNGFKTGFGKSTGADIMLIQNGKRIRRFDGAFMYADHFVSMGDHDPFRGENLKGSLYKKILNWGSIGLARALKNLKNKEITKEYDILWSAQLPVGSSKENFIQRFYFFPLKSFYDADRLLKHLAETSSLKIAYQVRRGVYEETIQELHNLNLYSEKITYIDGNKESIYTNMLKSEIVMTCFSTSVLEAIGWNQTGGYINLSENDGVNYYHEDLDIEYRKDSPISLEEFIQKIRNMEIDRKFVIQNPKYFEDLVKEIREIVNN